MNKTIKFSLFALGAFASTVSSANQITSDFLKKEIELAHSQYLQGSPESGLYALQALSRVLELNNGSAELGPNNLSFTYLRIGLLHEKAGNQDKAEENYIKAVRHYSDKNADITALKDVVIGLDQKRS
ncbi:hypothetical protein [Alteromonas gracilis]|uniref:hypothetical protein n=1 Tax=Alteromonas gracilis TaxID=1479524 RepID=UPI003735C6F9